MVNIPVARQISTSAKYYEPGVYGLGAKTGADLSSVLSFYRDLSLVADPAAVGFVPMSAVPARGRNTKLFAIGILPPNIVIDDSKLLDRSASISSLTGGVFIPEGADQNTTEAELEGGEEIPHNIDAISIEPGQSTSIDAKVFRRSLGALNSLHESIKPLALQLVEAAKRKGILLIVMEGTRTAERQDKLYAQGRGDDAGKHPIVTHAKSGGSWHQYGLAFDVAIAGQSGQPTWPPGDDVWGTVGILGEELGLTWGGHFSPKKLDRPHFEYHPGFELEEARGGRRPALAPPAPVPLKADADSAVFVGYGSSNANTFRRNLACQVDFLQVQLLSNQRAYMLAIKTALQAMMNTPPLRLLVNPNSFGVKSQKIVSDGNWGRNGPIIEFWGDDQDKISGSGQVAAFYALDANPVLGRGGPGLTRHARNHSLAWQNFQSLYLLYRNNGGMYLADLSQQDKDILLTTVGSVYLFYDNILYIGSFDSLNVSEADSKPFTVEYSFEFTVRAAFLLDFPPSAEAFKDSALGSDLPTQSNSTSTRSINDTAAFGGTVIPAATVQGAVSSASDALVGGVVAVGEFLAGAGF